MYLRKSIAIGMTTVILGACQDSSSDGEGNQLLTGRFVDAPVHGLQYSTATRSGQTGMGGEFLYQAGETVRFFLGNIQLGETRAQTVVTPLQLVADGDRDNTQVINRVRLLMLLDSDGNPHNGISISPTLREAAQALSAVDFNASDFTAELDELKNTIAVADARIPLLADIQQAQTHLSQSVLCEFGGLYTGNYSGGAVGVWSMVLDYATGEISGIGRNTDIDGERFAGYGQFFINAERSLIAGITLGSDNVVFIPNAPPADSLIAMPEPVETEPDATWTGRIDGGMTMSGTWQSGNERGVISGEKQIQQPIASGVNYRGVYSGENLLHTNDYGVFTIAVGDGGNVSGGGFTLKGGGEIFLRGTQMGDAFDLIVNSSNGGIATMTGTLDGNIISGTWKTTDGELLGTMSACRIY